jgi:hypothetical protein
MFTSIHKNLPGGANMGGIPQYVEYALHSDVVQWPTVSSGSSLDDSATLSGALMLKQGVNFNRIYITDDTGELELEPVGEKDGKSFVMHLRFFHPGLQKKILGFINSTKNENLIFIVPDNNGNRYIMGAPLRPATFDSSPDGVGTGKETSARAGASLHFSFKTSTLYVANNVSLNSQPPPPDDENLPSETDNVFATNVGITFSQSNGYNFIPTGNYENKVFIHAGCMAQKTATGAYSFSSTNNCVEFMSEYAWYVANVDNNGFITDNKTKLPLSTLSITIPNEAIGKALFFSVRPGCIHGLGQEVFSVSPYFVEEIRDVVTLENSFANDVTFGDNNEFIELMQPAVIGGLNVYTFPVVHSLEQYQDLILFKFENLTPPPANSGWLINGVKIRRFLIRIAIYYQYEGNAYFSAKPRLFFKETPMLQWQEFTPQIDFSSLVINKRSESLIVTDDGFRTSVIQVDGSFVESPSAPILCPAVSISQTAPHQPGFVNPPQIVIRDVRLVYLS